MKALIVILSIFVSAQAFAIQPLTRLTDGDVSLMPIDGQVDVVADFGHCPANAKCVAQTLVNVRYTLFGCMDRLTVYEKVVLNVDGSADVYVTALNIQNEASFVTMCTAMPIQQQQIFVGYGVHTSQVRVHFMGLPDFGFESSAN